MTSPTNISDDLIYRHSVNVAYREVGGEILLVPIRTDAKEPSGIYTLNRTASFLWTQIDGATNVQTLFQQLVAQFDVTESHAMSDTKMLIADLIDFGAIDEV